MTDPVESATSSAPNDSRQRWLFGTIGVLVGIAIGTALCLVTDDDAGADRPGSASITVDPAVADAADQARLVDEFLDAWFRYRTADLVVEWSFVRERPDGEQLESIATLVQRPPDRLYGLLGSVSGVVGGQLVNCDAAAPQSDDAQCVATEAVTAYEDRIRAEQRTRSIYFIGSPPLYHLADGGPGCYDVVAAVSADFFPWGTSARFCFDAETGALSESVMDHGNLVETLVATTIRDTVTDDDFEAALPEG